MPPARVAQTHVERRKHDFVVRGDTVTATPAILQITLNRRIWRVTLDDVFYGDYRTHRHAAESAEAKAAALRAQGRRVTIIAPQGPT